jgi:hypothetical protein
MVIAQIQCTTGRCGCWCCQTKSAALYPLPCGWPRTELEFRDRIEADIAEGGGTASHLQARMLKSIDRHIAASGLSPEEIRSTKQQRDLATMRDGLGFDRLLYITGQKIGSHHIHGTWSGLLTHYLEERNDAGTLLLHRVPDPTRPTSTSLCLSALSCCAPSGHSPATW